MSAVWRPFQELVRYELLVALRTRRAWLLGLLYLGSALISGVGFLYAVRAIERELQGALLESGLSALSAGSTMALVSSPAYEKLVGFFAGVPFEEMALALRGSVVMPMFFAGSVFFLPTLIVLTTYDQVVADVQSRSIVFAALRVPRHTILLGKLAAQAVYFFALSAGAALVLGAATLVMVDSVDVLTVLAGLARVWVVLLPYGAVYLGLSFLCSTLARQPSAALYSAMGLMFALTVFDWLGSVDPESSYAPLRHLAVLSPSTYVPGLWRAGLVAPLTSSLVLLGFAAAFTGLAAWRLEQRDL